ncbi:uncharacterized protein LOC135469076 [Liolophura sinensis]|uniref:uncharacterized protein LOC135469076 n=1 Tax=Liolophura sinensis TaxID=3198878 RepID=UPI003158CD5B
MAEDLTPDQYGQVLEEMTPILVDTLTLDSQVYSELLQSRLYNHNMVSTIRTQPTFSQKVKEVNHFLVEKLKENTNNFNTFCHVLTSTGQGPISNMLKQAVRRRIKELKAAEADP